MRLKIIFSAFLLIHAFASRSQVANSVLSTGEWYKIGVTEKGVYKIDRSLLENMGVNISSINPKKIAIYGNGGNGMLPQSNATPRADDLIENTIFVAGQNDEIFDNTDYILFYGNSPDFIKYDTSEDMFQYENNLYSDTTFYFFTIKETDGLRMSNRENAGNDFQKVTSFKDVFIHETDETNLIKGGRMWFGETFSSSQPNHGFTFNTQNVLAGGEIKIRVSAMAQAFVNTSFDLSLNQFSLGNIIIEDVPNSTYGNKGRIQQGDFQVNSSSLNNISAGLTLDLHYNVASSGPSTGFLDYCIIQAESELSMTDNTFHFYNTSGLSNATFEISTSNSDIIIWDVSQPYQVVNQLYDSQNSKITFGISNETTELIAFSGSDFPTPIFTSTVENQNLHSLSAADAVFITHPKFLSQANDLKKHREKNNGFSIHLVTVDQVYNEFSSGMQDISAIRDFIKHIYDKKPEKLKYTLLFGDCSYDYKNRSITQTNYVPVYEARNSLHPLYDFSSDDYFGFMENHEGEWIEDESGDHTMEIGVGRLPVKTQQEAADVVSKIIRYETSTNAFGKWRNELLFIADDGDNNIHQRDANYLATYVEETRSEFNTNKLFLDAYEQIPSPSGQTSPTARDAFEKAIAEGKLMVNYTGHGNESQLTVEKIIDENQISELKNRSKLPFFITATCEFGNYDNPDRVSGGEKTLLNPNGGAIALLTSTRPVFSNTNFILNEAYYYAAMEKVDGEFPRLGDIIKNTKNRSLEGAKNRNFALLGDPTMRLAFPKYELVITSINGKVIDKADTLKALSKIRMQGEVRRGDQSVVTDFSGKMSMTVYDKPTQFSTLGNENTVPQKFNRRDALIFKGEASVTNGDFSIEFVVPKNISYVFGEGKISMYAVTSGDLPIDANGSNVDFKVGGSNPDAPEDITPPKISLYMNDSLFVSGQTTGSDPLFLAKLFDESGINISNEGFGQDVSMSINGGEEIQLNDFYSASLDSYQEGWVSYPLKNLEPGKHSIKFKAYDTYNNASQTEINFIVTNNTALKLGDISVYPNPFFSEKEPNVTFTFSHDREGEELVVLLKIINLQGRVISESSYRFDDSFAGINSIEWNGKDAQGNRPDKGIYIYRLNIQSTLDGAKNQVHRKLVIY
ncbi:type IX secretion system sortase PorU [Reichenbachiella sp. MALMAid0571]|uniref:type IX secretion system sortase PorU n=1 Tax=Reichenbachiella sp. MALMAid0571 TaxID=3143939 RepID=UPI0032DE51C5